MKDEKLIIDSRECLLCVHNKAEFLLVQPADEHDLSAMEREADLISGATQKPFTLVAFKVNDWQSELTPWSAPPVFGKTPFGDGAAGTLSFITANLLPHLAERGIYSPSTTACMLGGYSLAGLFALWCAYQTSAFCGIAAASPSVWYPNWTDFARDNTPLARAVYLSLGDKEDKARNPLMAQVAHHITTQHRLLIQSHISTVLEWNPGNHFVDAEKRMARGFAWIINNIPTP